MPNDTGVLPGTTLAPSGVWRKLLRGSVWLAALRFGERGLGMVRIVILARLLTPHDFGLVGVGLLAMALMRRFSDTGVREALIQKSGDIDDYLGTAWTVNFLRDLTLALIMVSAAPLIATFFDAPEATAMLRVIAISWIFSGLRNIGLVHIHREMAFNRFFFYQLAQIVAELSVSIALAFILRNAWALVIGLLVSNFVAMVLSYVVAPRPKRIRVNFRHALELFRFGRWVLGSQMISFLLTQLDRIVVGRMAGVVALGLYQMAANISSMTSHELMRVVSRATFPAYAQLQSDKERVRDVYLKVIQVTALIALPVAVGTVLVADGLTRHVLGEQWVPISRTLQILAVWGALLSLSRTTSPLFSGMGRPDLYTKTQAARATVLAVLIYPLTRFWGMEGAATAALLSSVLVDPWQWMLALRMVSGRLTGLLNAVAPALAGSIAIVSAVGGMRLSQLSIEDLLPFIGMMTAGVFAYPAGLAIWAVAAHWNPKELLRLSRVDPNEPAPSGVANSVGDATA